jgi:beta-lactamase class A
MIKKINHRTKITIIIFSFLAGNYYVERKDDKTSNHKTENHETGYKYISPLLDCENTLPLNYNYTQLKSSIQKIIDTKISNHEVGSISLYYRDLNNGPWIEINPDDKFSPASLLKVPLMMAYLKLAEDNHALLSKKLIVGNYQEDDSPNILPQKMVKAGEEYTVEELITYMIKYSDNIAANTLLVNIPKDDLTDIYTDFNLAIPGSDGSENYMTVTDYSSFFRILYNASYLDREMSEKALKILATSTFTQGLTANLPSNIKVSHKFGERVFEGKKQLHDCGIVYLTNKNYLLCIMTRGDNFTKMENTIANISKNIFDNVNSFTN